MNRGVLPVQAMMVAGNRNPSGFFHHQLIPATPPPLPPPTATTVATSWHGEFNYQDQQLLTAESWSQLLLGGMMGSGLEKKLENLEEQASNYNMVYGHGGNNSDGNNWSQMISSSVTNSFSNNNMLNFSSNNNPHPSSSECNSSTTMGGGGGAAKKARVQPSSTQATFKVRKEKLGDRITALHQIVSPFGKTDTASVLLEAIGYIRFLQGQIEALSLPYMGEDEAGNMIKNQPSVHHSLFPDDPGQLLNDHQYCTIKKRKGAPDHHHHHPHDQGECEICNEDAITVVKKDLRSRGLCLVPVSCTIMQVESGADYWTQASAGARNFQHSNI